MHPDCVLPSPERIWFRSAWITIEFTKESLIIIYLLFAHSVEYHFIFSHFGFSCLNFVNNSVKQWLRFSQLAIGLCTERIPNANIHHTYITFRIWNSIQNKIKHIHFHLHPSDRISHHILSQYFDFYLV